MFNIAVPEFLVPAPESNFLVNADSGRQMIAQLIGFPPHIWEMWVELLTLGFNLIQPWFLEHLKNEPVGG